MVKTKENARHRKARRRQSANKRSQKKRAAARQVQKQVLEKGKLGQPVHPFLLFTQNDFRVLEKDSIVLHEPEQTIGPRNRKDEMNKYYHIKSLWGNDVKHDAPLEIGDREQLFLFLSLDHEVTWYSEKFPYLYNKYYGKGENSNVKYALLAIAGHQHDMTMLDTTIVKDLETIKKNIMTDSHFGSKGTYYKWGLKDQHYSHAVEGISSIVEYCCKKDKQRENKDKQHKVTAVIGSCLKYIDSLVPGIVRDSTTVGHALASLPIPKQAAKVGQDLASGEIVGSHQATNRFSKKKITYPVLLDGLPYMSVAVSVDAETQNAHTEPDGTFTLIASAYHFDTNKSKTIFRFHLSGNTKIEIDLVPKAFVFYSAYMLTHHQVIKTANKNQHHVVVNAYDSKKLLCHGAKTCYRAETKKKESKKK